MRRRRTRTAACTVAVAAVVSLSPLGIADATPSPHNPTCAAIKQEQAGAAEAGFAIEKAIASGNFASAKRQMLHAYDTDLTNVTRALAAIKSAPPDVRAAFKSLRTYVRRIRGDIKHARSLSQLEAELQALGRDPALQADSTTIAAWANSVCKTSSSSPSSSSSEG